MLEADDFEDVAKHQFVAKRPLGDSEFWMAFDLQILYFLYNYHTILYNAIFLCLKGWDFCRLKKK